MNKLIDEQLKKCKVADLSQLDTKTGKCFIPRFKQVKVEEDSCYLIKLEDSLLKPNVNDTYHINWNKGVIPPNNYLVVDISRVVGKNIYVNAIEYDIENKQPTTNTWNGWLPLERIEVLERM